MAEIIEKPDFPARDNPPTQVGIEADFQQGPEGAQSTRIDASSPDIIGSRPDPAVHDSIDGMGSIGRDIDGWHPRADNG